MFEPQHNTTIQNSVSRNVLLFFSVKSQKAQQTKWYSSLWYLSYSTAVIKLSSGNKLFSYMTHRKVYLWKRWKGNRAGCKIHAFLKKVWHFNDILMTFNCPLGKGNQWDPKRKKTNMGVPENKMRGAANVQFAAWYKTLGLCNCM